MREPRRRIFIMSDTMPGELLSESRRLERSRSWLAQLAWRIARQKIREHGDKVEALKVKP